MKKILCLDGGGMLGLLSVRILQRLERDLAVALTGAPLADAPSGNLFGDHFDLVAGTSTGSILAAGIALGMPLERIGALYAERGRRIFDSGLAHWIGRVRRSLTAGISHPKYGDRGLEQELRRALRLPDGREPRLGDLQRRILIPSFDATVHEPVLFKTGDPVDAADLELPLWEIVKASCSAPTYFPSHTLRYRRQLKKRAVADPGETLLPPEARVSAMIDGGVFANNPTMAALAELFSGVLDDAHGPDPDMLVISVGTSQPIAEGLSPDQGRRMGVGEWALPMLDIFMGGAALHVHALAYRVVERNRRSCYVRFEIITREGLSMDAAGAGDVAMLENVAAAYLDGHPQDALLADLHYKNWYDYAGNLARIRAALG